LGLSALAGRDVHQQTALVDTFRTLLVDDDVDAAQHLKMHLESQMGRAVVVPDVYQALARHAEDPFDVVVLEVALPGASGIDLLERLAPAVPAVVVTWLTSPAITARALQAGAHSVHTKPCRIADLLTVVRMAVRTRHGLEVVRI
jgi:DNA-binding response OmpR family regulator